MANAAERVFSLIKETVEGQGVELLDVRFLKEGASWYLRVFIDKEGGVDINDCTDVSHAIDPILDMGRTMLNVNGTLVSALVVDRSLRNEKK